jgi:1-aminocyclopropane-1-carboxylate deaminase/D-cysteine desulfhydrase-like pyridoxal-dependent ACC family enzyme
MLLNHDLSRKVKKIEEEMKKLREEIQKRKKEDYHFYLYNILDDHWIEIKSDLKRLENMMDYLIYHKYFTKNFTSDEEFIRMNEEIRDRIIKI